MAYASKDVVDCQTTKGNGENFLCSSVNYQKYLTLTKSIGHLAIGTPKVEGWCIEKDMSKEGILWVDCKNCKNTDLNLSRSNRKVDFNNDLF